MNLKSKLLVPFFLSGLFSCASKSVPVEYVTTDQHTLKADLYLPTVKSSEPIPLVVVIHGGGWRNRSGDMQGVCEVLTENGFAALNITYRFAPEHRFPVQLNDVKAAIPWILKNAEKYNLNGQKVAVWGYSAGAHLAFLLANQKELGIKFGAIVVGGMPAYFPNFPESPLIIPLIGKKYTEDPQAWVAASPVSFVSEATPPTFVYHAVDDALVTFNEAVVFEEKLKKFRVQHEVYRVENRGHISLYYFPEKSEEKGIGFLKAHIGK